MTRFAPRGHMPPPSAAWAEGSSTAAVSSTTPPWPSHRCPVRGTSPRRRSPGSCSPASSARGLQRRATCNPHLMAIERLQARLARLEKAKAGSSLPADPAPASPPREASPVAENLAPACAPQATPAALACLARILDAAPLPEAAQRERAPSCTVPTADYDGHERRHAPALVSAEAMIASGRTTAVGPARRHSWASHGATRSLGTPAAPRRRRWTGGGSALRLGPAGGGVLGLEGLDAFSPGSWLVGASTGVSASGLSTSTGNREVMRLSKAEAGLSDAMELFNASFADHRSPSVTRTLRFTPPSADSGSGALRRARLVGSGGFDLVEPPEPAAATAGRRVGCKSSDSPQPASTARCSCAGSEWAAVPDHGERQRPARFPPPAVLAVATESSPAKEEPWAAPLLAAEVTTAAPLCGRGPLPPALHTAPLSPSATAGPTPPSPAAVPQPALQRRPSPRPPAADTSASPGGERWVPLAAPQSPPLERKMASWRRLDASPAVAPRAAAGSPAAASLLKELAAVLAATAPAPGHVGSSGGSVSSTPPPPRRSSGRVPTTPPPPMVAWQSSATKGGASGFVDDGRADAEAAAEAATRPGEAEALQAELSSLAAKAREAAVAFPECAPLAEALRCAIARELEALQSPKQAIHGYDTPAPQGGSSAGASPAQLLGSSRRLLELRAAADEGLQVLGDALSGGGGSATGSPAAARAPTASGIGTSRRPQQREMAKVFGAVAANMQQALFEIRHRKRHAGSRFTERMVQEDVGFKSPPESRGGDAGSASPRLGRSFGSPGAASTAAAASGGSSPTASYSMLSEQQVSAAAAGGA